MKRLVILIIAILASFEAFASGPEYLRHVIDLYEHGRYEEAIQGFNICKTFYFDELPISEVNDWISKCEQGISKRNAAAAVRRARLAKAERVAYEAKQREREMNKLIYVSSNALTLNGDYPALQNAIVKGIQDAGHSCTGNESDSYLTVYVSATAEILEGTDPKSHFVMICARVKIINNISGEIYEDVINEKVGSRISYNDAAKLGFRKYIIAPLNDVITNNIG